MSGGAGGSGAVGGFAFQARLGAIAGVHLLRGMPVLWTDDLTEAAPRAISFETSGPGGDLSLELADGSHVEIQAKKGLQADGRFWSALDALCEGVHAEHCAFGLLLVCPDASGTVRRHYARALRRIGDGRNDNAPARQAKLLERLEGRGYDAARICARIRIKTVSALEDAGDAVAAARAELAHVCARDEQVIPAWKALCQDAQSAMEYQGRRTLQSLSACLRVSHIEIQDAVKDSPVAVRHALLRSGTARTEHFAVLGIGQLPTDVAWLPLRAIIGNASDEPATSVEEALARYRALGEKSGVGVDEIDARTIGSFRGLCVVVGGPGSGKSLLLRVLAREFAKDSLPSVRVRLRELATRVRETGCGVEAGLLQLGLDGTGVSPEQTRVALTDLVLLCDGLDECGDLQERIAEGLKDVSASRPSWRIVVTTRPIGYSTRELQDWRHYEIARLAERDTARHIETLVGSALAARGREQPDGLSGSIRAYVREGGAPGILGGSPLLLAFGAALFMASSGASGTKFELYRRMYRLMDDAPGIRKAGLDPPPREVRDSVVNHLGWLLAASPLAAAETVERQCARRIERVMRTTYLQALAFVEGSVRYWEQTGLIERLRHPGAELIAFVHKTCGEFAAAQHLSDLEPADARLAMAEVVSNPDWDEILDFATGTSLATMLAELLVEEFEADEADEATLNRLFRVLVRPETSLSPEERGRLLARVFALARSEDRRKVYRAGLCLSQHDLSGMPEAAELATALLSAGREWSRLVGWAVLVRHFPGSVQRDDLEEALRQFMESSRAEDFFVLRESRLPFGPIPDRGVFHNFVIAALEVLLAETDRESQDRLIAEVRESQATSTFGFESRFDPLLRELGREDAARPPFRAARIIEAVQVSAPDGFRDVFQEGSLGLLSDVVPAAFSRAGAGAPPETGLKCLAAFVGMAGILDVPAYDVHVWESDPPALSAVHELVRAAAQVFGLPADRLAEEAGAALEAIESLRGEGARKSVLSVLPDVDAAEVDWDHARRADIDAGTLEALVNHPSQWVQQLATIFLNERLEGTGRRVACERLLASGTGEAFYWTAALTATLPDGNELLLGRLRGRAEAGLHHLFDRLRETGRPVTQADLPALENGLLRCDATTAVAAARWCEAAASHDDAWLADLLGQAASHWLAHEEPVGGFIVPDSPRAALLRTLCRVESPNLDELVELAGDSRRDVCDAALDGMVGLATGSAAARSNLVEYILGGRFPAQQCEKLLGISVPYSMQDLTALRGLCQSPEAKYRLVAAKRLLAHPGMDRAEARATAEAMRIDADGNVRDAAHRFLDGGTDRP